MQSRQSGTNGTGKPTQQYRRCRWVPPTSMGRHHLHRYDGSTGTVQIRQSGTSGTSSSCTNQIIACSFWSILGRVAGQHSRVFLLVCRPVAIEQNPWYNNDTQKKKDFKKLISRHKKENVSCTS